MRIFLVSLSICLGLFLFCSGVQGETPGPAPASSKPVLGLPDLIRLAIEKSPEIAEARSDVLSSRFDLEQAKAGQYPQIETIAAFGPAPPAKRPFVSSSGEITDPSPGLTLDTVGIFGRLDLTATQPLYTFGKLANRQEAAARGVQAKEYRIDQKKAETVLRVTEMYYGLVVAKTGLDSVSEADDFFNDAQGRIRRLLDAGSTSVKDSDLYRIEAYRAESRRFRAEAEKGLRVSYLALKATIGLPAGSEFEPADKTLGVRAEDLPGMDYFVNSALSNRPEFKQLKEGLAAQEAMIKAAESDRYPSIFAAAKASVAGATGRDTLDNRYIPDEFNHYYGGVFAGAKWDLDFGISKAKVEKARAEYSKLLNQQRMAELGIPIQVAKSYQDHVEYGQAVRFYQEAATAARKWVVTALTDFDMGTETADEMLRAIEKYGQNQGRYIEALFKYNLSLAQLEFAAGLRTW